MSRVFVVEQPPGARPYDLTDAERFGIIVKVSQPEDGGFYGREAIARISASMASFTERDYLIAGIGHPLSVAWASAIAARKSGGRLKLLYWNRKKSCYIPVCGDIFEGVS